MQEVQALATLAAANMAQATDRALTRLGAPPYVPRTISAAARICEAEISTNLPGNSTATLAPGQELVAAASSAAPVVPTLASTAPLASSAAPTPGTAQYVLVLQQRLGLREELVAALVPHMPQILQHLLPGSDGEKRLLQTLLLSGYDLAASWGPYFVERLKSTVQSNAIACAQLLSAASKEAEAPGTVPASTAAVPAAPQVASSSQDPALHSSMAEPFQQPHGSAALLGDAHAAESRAAPPTQPYAAAGRPIGSGQQPSAAAPAQGVTEAPGAGASTLAADVSSAVQPASAPEQPQLAGAAIPEAASPAAKVSAVVPLSLTADPCQCVYGV